MLNDQNDNKTNFSQNEMQSMKSFIVDAHKFLLDKKVQLLE